VSDLPAGGHELRVAPGAFMAEPLVAVLDYGIGNLHSAQKALERVGADARLTTDPGLVRDADAVVLPGVGAFGACLDALRAAGLEPVVHDAVASGRPFLGVCVGCQMLFDGSDEDPTHRGLGVIPGRVVLLPDTVKRPQMQWNALTLTRPEAHVNAAFRHRSAPAWMYFVHSFHGIPDDPGVVVATCDYGTTVHASFERDNVMATQFHPEKSGRDGLALLAGFVRLAAGDREAS
jgi:glutamine amidotransferase